MKKYTYPALLAILLLAPLSAQATVTVVLDAGQLTSSVLAPMHIDDSTGSPNGSLMLLFDLGTGNLATPLTAGKYVAGNNTILAAAGFEDFSGAPNEAFTSLVFNMGSAKVGDELALRWFPQITLAQYQSGTVLPTAGQFYGTFNPNGAATDGGNAWILPSDGATINLTFNTLSAGGSEPDTAGFAGTTVLPAIGAVPEPSTYALFGLAGLVLILTRRRLKQDSSK